jgi:hypothetical protein
VTFVPPSTTQAARDLLQELVSDPLFPQLVSLIHQKNAIYAALEQKHNNGQHISSALLRQVASELVHDGTVQTIATTHNISLPDARQRVSFAASMASDRI